MAYQCPKCKRWWMEWCGRAKILLCHGSSCKHVIRNVEMAAKIPTPDEIEKAIQKDLDSCE